MFSEFTTAFISRNRRLELLVCRSTFSSYGVAVDVNPQNVEIFDSMFSGSTTTLEIKSSPCLVGRCAFLSPETTITFVSECGMTIKDSCFTASGVAVVTVIGGFVELDEGNCGYRSGIDRNDFGRLDDQKEESGRRFGRWEKERLQW
jgi:hypothetical protein